MNKRDLGFLLGGAAAGIVATTVALKLRKNAGTQKRSDTFLFDLVCNTGCWPIKHPRLKAPKTIHVISCTADFTDVIVKFLAEVNQVSQESACLVAPFWVVIVNGHH